MTCVLSKKLRSSDVSVPELGIFATLIERVDGGPMRTVLDASPKRAVGWYASQKNGGGQFHESRNERNAFYLAEVATRVVGYRAQPHTLEIIIDGKVRTYTPDREDRLSDGRIEIIEVKGDYNAERDPQYHAKLEVARIVYARLGWSFRILEQAEIEAQPCFNAVEYIQSLRSTVIMQIDEDRVIQRLASSSVVTLSEIRGLWGTPILGFAKMCALMVKRTISIDFESGLSDRTLVRLVVA
jgi:hypothetical protein